MDHLPSQSFERVARQAITPDDGVSRATAVTRRLPTTATECAGSPRNGPHGRPHEIAAPASHFARMTSSPFRGLPWAQGVAGSNPVAPTTSRLRLCNGCATGSGKGACLGALFVVRRPSQNPRQPTKQRQTHRGVTGGVKHRDGHAVMVQHRMDEHRSRKRFRAETGGAALEGGATATGAQ